MNRTILSVDTYIVINKTIVDEIYHKLIAMLYQPIIGHTATTLYFTLFNDLVRGTVISQQLIHHHLMGTIQLKLEDTLIGSRVNDEIVPRDYILENKDRVIVLTDDLSYEHRKIL